MPSLIPFTVLLMLFLIYRLPADVAAVLISLIFTELSFAINLIALSRFLYACIAVTPVTAVPTATFFIVWLFIR